VANISLSFTPHINCGDHVVVVSMRKRSLLTGKKMADKKYYRHTGHPGGIKEATAEHMLSAAASQKELVKLAVKRMMPKESPLARTQFSQLHVYAGAEHKHEGSKASEA
jgi:large subunit ribosomal protein L13